MVGYVPGTYATNTALFEAGPAFSDVGFSDEYLFIAGESFSYQMGGTFDATVAIEYQIGGGAWVPIQEVTEGMAEIVYYTLGGPTGSTIRVRFNCTAYTSGDVFSTIFAAPDVLRQFSDKHGKPIFTITTNGIEVNGSMYLGANGNVSLSMLNGQSLDPQFGAFFPILNANTLKEYTSGHGVAMGNQLIFGTGTTFNFGETKSVGLAFKVYSEIVNLAAAGAKFKALASTIPAGSVIIAAQANADSLIVAGGTSVKFALGQNAGTVNKYGLGGALTLNTKLNQMNPAFPVLAGNEQIDVCAVNSAGTALGDTNFSAGTVAVRIYYYQPVSMRDAS